MIARSQRRHQSMVEKYSKFDPEKLKNIITIEVEDELQMEMF